MITSLDDDSGKEIILQLGGTFTKTEDNPSNVFAVIDSLLMIITSYTKLILEWKYKNSRC